MTNDLIRLAMERAAAHDTDGTFSHLHFSAELVRFACLPTDSAPLDADLVRVILTGRTDVVPINGLRYRLVREGSVAA